MAEGEGEQAAAQQKLTGKDPGEEDYRQATSLSDIGTKQNTSINDSSPIEKGGLVKVPVNEDFLFDVDIEHRELAPTYWLGPIYNVRRGSWFYQEGSTLRPCDENLASQLEEGYLKVKPWRNAAESTQGSSSKSRSETGPTQIAEYPESTQASGGIKEMPENVKTENSIPAKFELQTQRLFGSYMNSVVTYQDASTAWLLTDDFLSRMSSTVYQRFAGGGHLGGVKVARGYSEASKAKDVQKENNQTTKSIKKGDASEDVKKQSAQTREISLQDEQLIIENPPKNETPKPETQTEPRLLVLERQVSNIVSSPDSEDPVKQDEEVRRRDENEIREDYKDEGGQDQGREIEHLVLVVGYTKISYSSWTCVFRPSASSSQLHARPHIF